MIRTFYAITRKNKEGKTVYYDYYNQVWLVTIDMDCLFLKKDIAESIAESHWKKGYYKITTFELKEIEE
jgi:hypothetical protein